MTWLIVGAGPAGLAAMRAFKQAGLAWQAVESHADVGGQWLHNAANSAVYDSTHLISSKGTTAFTGFPMPADWPAYPHHAQIGQYMRDFARHFDLYPGIRFNTTLTRLVPEGDGWHASFDDGRSGVYVGVVIANGHLSQPSMPALPGSFNGTLLHSKAYKNPDIFAGKRVLIVGAGNTGCDIVVDAVHRASRVLWSLRGGNHFTPKFVAGKPADAGNHNRRFVLPRWLRSRLHEAALRILVGPPERFGLPKPKHRLYDRTPIVNSLVLQHLGQGDVDVRAPIERLDGDHVVFKDGRRDAVDIVLLATGYRTVFPFIDTAELNWRDPAPQLYLNIFPPRHHNLFVAGLLEGAGIGWPGRDLQAEAITAYIKAMPEKRAAFQQRVAAYCAAPRPADAGEHGIFVDFLEYKRVLQKTISSLR
ncbi:NAD(P)-binding domain-containing protein [Ferrovibrio sp.]|uniref:flavin-containing monooxygenase n=1 Tax=Ferrovibrio sp. TaxID=1917215 RepID=UPI0025BBDC65|nr:NAD(P)-binding domain-containing protein [Ferrovibrio sp.]MBX3456394.1 NAD(P)-binding domain-containing protein [Ferrovibrio sp.]